MAKSIFKTMLAWAQARLNQQRSERLLSPLPAHVCNLPGIKPTVGTGWLMSCSSSSERSGSSARGEGAHHHIGGGYKHLQQQQRAERVVGAAGHLLTLDEGGGVGVLRGPLEVDVVQRRLLGQTRREWRAGHGLAPRSQAV